MGLLNDEMNGANEAERSNRAAGDDGKIGIKRSDWNQTEIGTPAKQLFGAERRQRVVQVVALGQCGGERRVLEVPHERSGVEKLNSSYADGM